MTDVPLDQCGNLASHFHNDPDCRSWLYNLYPSHAANITHYSRIASQYCPRVLQQCERIIKIHQEANFTNDITRYITTRHPDALKD
jgi:hypothetical protein